MNIVELAPGMPVGFRDGTPADHPFIFNSWLKGHHEAGDWPRRLGIPRCVTELDEFGKNTEHGGCSCCRFSHRRYFDEHKHVIARLLEGSKVIVACNPANERQIMGYIVFQPDVLHWIYVKSAWRWDKSAEHHPRMGTALLRQALPDERSCIECSHWTMSAERLRDKWLLEYRPFMLEAQ